MQQFQRAAKLALTGVFCSLVGGATMSCAGRPTAPTPSTEWRLPIPDEGAGPAWRDALDEMARTVGLRGPLPLPASRPATGWRPALKHLEDWSGGGLTVRFEGGDAILSLDRAQLRRRPEPTRDAFRRFLEETFPAAAAAAKAQYGTWILSPTGGAARRLESGMQLPARVVVLVHGLDEPGGLWRDLVPELNRAGYQAVEFCYPNDQPVLRSTGELAAALQALRQVGAHRADLVAHSMGGLLCRALLTGPEFYGGQSDGGETFPGVYRFIMVGTPNHGADLARFRLTAEARDQLVRTLSGDGVLFGAFFDGAGQAGKDLLPESLLIRTINERPLPHGVAVTIVAGRASPITRRRLASLARHLPDVLGTPTREQLVDGIGRLTDGVGDGAVSVASTRLAGVTDHVIVPGNHISMLRRTVRGVGALPAAIPVILNRLATPLPGHASPDPVPGSTPN